MKLSEKLAGLCDYVAHKTYWNKLRYDALDFVISNSDVVTPRLTPDLTNASAQLARHVHANRDFFLSLVFDSTTITDERVVLLASLIREVYDQGGLRQSEESYGTGRHVVRDPRRLDSDESVIADDKNLPPKVRPAQTADATKDPLVDFGLTTVDLTCSDVDTFIKSQLAKAPPVGMMTSRDMAVMCDLDTALRSAFSGEIRIKFHTDEGSFATLGWRSSDAKQTCFRPGGQFCQAPVILYRTGRAALVTAEVDGFEYGRGLLYFSGDLKTPSQVTLFNTYPAAGHYASVYLQCAILHSMATQLNLPNIIPVIQDEHMIPQRRSNNPDLFFNENPYVLTKANVACPVIINNTRI